MEEVYNTPMQFILRPFGAGSESLTEHTVKELSSDELVIGRNLIAPCEYRSFVSRCHVSVFSKDGQLYLIPKTRPGVVYVNGTSSDSSDPVKLHVGDKISLLGIRNLFNFRIFREAVPPVSIYAASSVGEVKDGAMSIERKRKRARTDREEYSVLQGKECSSTNQASSSSSGAGPTSASSVHRVLECAICLQFMALSYSVAPCGHNFCYTCITDWLKANKACPTCASKATGTIPARAIDELILDLIQRESPDCVADVHSRTELARKILADASSASSKPPTAPAKSKQLGLFAPRSANGVVSRGGRGAVIDLS
jgi:hypothetical protein